MVVLIQRHNEENSMQHHPTCQVHWKCWWMIKRSSCRPWTCSLAEAWLSCGKAGSSARLDYQDSSTSDWTWLTIHQNCNPGNQHQRYREITFTIHLQLGSHLCSLSLLVPPPWKWTGWRIIVAFFRFPNIPRITGFTASWLPYWCPLFFFYFDQVIWWRTCRFH